MGTYLCSAVVGWVLIDHYLSPGSVALEESLWFEGQFSSHEMIILPWWWCYWRGGCLSSHPGVIIFAGVSDFIMGWSVRLCFSWNLRWLLAKDYSSRLLGIRAGGLEPNVVKAGNWISLQTLKLTLFLSWCPQSGRRMR